MLRGRRRESEAVVRVTVESAVVARAVTARVEAGSLAVRGSGEEMEGQG